MDPVNAEIIEPIDRDAIMRSVAVITALEKYVKQEKASARLKADALIYDAYEAIGADRIPIEMDGEKVGEITITFTTPSPVITDMEAYEAWATENDLTQEHVEVIADRLDIEKVRAMWPDAVRTSRAAAQPSAIEEQLTRAGEKVIYTPTGEIIPGVAYTERRPKHTVVRGCKPEDVLPAFYRRPLETLRLHLGGE